MSEQVGVMILGIGALVSLIGMLWLVIRAFQTSIGWGLVVLFLPLLGPFVFLIARFPKAKSPFALIVIGAIISIIPLIFTQILADRIAKVPFENKEQKQVVTRGAKDTKYDEVLSKHDVESVGFNNEDFNDELGARLVDFKSLKRLDLSDSGITDQTLTVIADLPNLEVLNLARCKGITDDGVKAFLAKTKSLKEINAKTTAVKIETLREWKKANPDRKTLP